MMNNMSEQEEGASCTKEYVILPDRNVPIDESDIIDVSDFDFDDHDRWLCEGTQFHPESKVRDLCAWLKSNSELDNINISKVNRKSIDSRTYVRAKRRVNRASFDAVCENISPLYFQLKNEKGFEASTPMHEQFKLGKFPEESNYVPHMLRPSFGSPISLYTRDNKFTPAPAGHESMDAFLNMSQSKGVDSFINMAEPEFSDVLMNVSQPSVLSSSLMASYSKDSLSFDMADSQILTNSMMQTSMFDETKDIKSFYAPFENDNLNDTVRMKSFDADKTMTVSEAVQLDQSGNFGNATRGSSTFVGPVELNATFSLGEKSDPKVLPEKQKNPLNDTYSKINEANVNTSKEYPMEKIDPTTKLLTEVEPVSNSRLEPATSLEARPINPNVVMKLRQELLKEARQSEDRKLDATFDMNSQKENVGHEMNLKYKKISQHEQRIEESKMDEANDHRFQTFSVKTYNAWKKEDNFNSTFSKPATQQSPKNAPRKLPMPQTFSKLPQSLQKSNPNLISGSLNAVNATEHVNKPSLRYPRGSQPNVTSNAVKSLGKKLNPLGRLKSGSDQRLMEVTHHVSDFHLSATGGSTESIESTQSAHSAPDFDDRLSICSDGSRGSYTIGKMNSEQFHKIAQMQEESLNREPTKVQPVLENTWVKEEEGKADPPSPIFKNGMESENSIDAESNDNCNFKTSSPISNAAKKNHNNTSEKANAFVKERVEQNLQPREVEEKPTRQGKSGATVEARSKLRPPTNFNAGVKPSSGIPRPMSRIPAPKMTRSKVAQSEWKKGYL